MAEQEIQTPADMDVLTWAKKHIEIPGMQAQVQVERKTEIIGMGYPRKRKANQSPANRQVREVRETRAHVRQIDRQILALQLHVAMLQVRLDERESGRRSE